ncbi:MAG: GAF domain-containing protein [Gammaproteobacteria bacterium]|nr:GAF domain-containing protein [Gammaproteobacteria bacterium]
MHRRYSLLAVLSLFVVAVTVWNCTMLLRYSGLPFALDPINPHSARVVSLRGLELPQGLHAGDRVEYAHQSTEARLSLLAVIEFASTTPEHSLPLVLTHSDGHRTRIDVPSRHLAAVPAFHVSTYLAFTWFILACLITLATLWRGRDRAAWGIAFWAIAFECGMAFYLAHASGWTILGFALASQLCYLAARIGFFLMADAVAAPALDHRTRRVFRIVFIATLAIGYAYELGYSLSFVFGGILVPPLVTLVWVLPYAVATAMLIAAHRGAEAAARPRLRWMFWSGVILTFGILLSNVALFGYATSYPIQIACYILAFAGLLYSVLRHRVVDMRFVVNRAIVYSAGLTVVVAIFILLESFAESFALGKRESLLLEFGVPLLIGFSLEAIRKRLEKLGEWVFFRHKFENEVALKRFANQCGYIENPDHLIEQTLGELRAHTSTPAVAFYWQEREGVYQLLAQSGDARFAPELDEDDRAVVAQRAERGPCGLEDLASALGDDGLALPMMVRGALLGTVVIVNRPGERYPADEQELLESLVHEVGSALHALHARENARLITAIAEGGLSGNEIRDRARALMPPV